MDRAIRLGGGVAKLLALMISNLGFVVPVFCSCGRFLS